MRWLANSRENSSTFRGLTAETGGKTKLAKGEMKKGMTYATNPSFIAKWLFAKASKQAIAFAIVPVAKLKGHPVPC